MEYLKGHTIKPHRITGLGEVLFTDGTNTNLIPNQASCEAYGYTYDDESGTCSAYRLNGQLPKNFANTSNNTKGGFAQFNTTNTLLNGYDNETKGGNTNCLISGNANRTLEGIGNATVLGVNGQAQRQSEFAIGGGGNRIEYGSGSYAYADRQFSLIELSGVTTDNSNTNLTVNGDGSSLINIKENSIVGYEIYITRLEVGGSAGTAGDFSYRNRKGVVQIDRTFSMNFIVGFTRNIGKVGGVNGTFTEVDSSTSDIKSWTIQVSDRNNVTNIWSAKVYLHELISTSVSWS